MTKKPKLRGGIVGSGFAANLHYEGMRRVHGADVDIAGIFSPTPANAQRFAEPRGLRTLPSLEALLDEGKSDRANEVIKKVIAEAENTKPQ